MHWQRIYACNQSAVSIYEGTHNKNFTLHKVPYFNHFIGATKMQQSFCLRNDMYKTARTLATAEDDKRLRVRFFTYFWLRIWKMQNHAIADFGTPDPWSVIHDYPWPLNLTWASQWLSSSHEYCHCQCGCACLVEAGIPYIRWHFHCMKLCKYSPLTGFVNMFVVNAL